MTAEVVSLSGFQVRAEIQSHPTNAERVWGRLSRFCDILTCGGIRDNAERLRIWDHARQAMHQYIDNEWPIEKNNKIRAAEIADKTAYLFVTGILNGQTDKACDLQSFVAEALEANGYAHQRWQLVPLIENYMQAYTGRTEFAAKTDMLPEDML